MFTFQNLQMYVWRTTAAQYVDFVDSWSIDHIERSISLILYNLGATHVDCMPRPPTVHSLFLPPSLAPSLARLYYPRCGTQASKVPLHCRAYLLLKHAQTRFRGLAARAQVYRVDPSMAADSTSSKIWQELRKLRDDIPPPVDNNADSNKGDQENSACYKDFAAFAACNEVRVAIGRSSELPRDQFLAIFTQLVAGPRLDELLDLFKLSRSPPHPALQYACLVALHGVAELSDRRKDLLTRPDVVEELCAAMASPRQRLVTPTSAGAGGVEIVNAAAGAITTITGLFTSNGYAVWDFSVSLDERHRNRYNNQHRNLIDSCSCKLYAKIFTD